MAKWSRSRRLNETLKSRFDFDLLAEATIRDRWATRRSTANLLQTHIGVRAVNLYGDAMRKAACRIRAREEPWFKSRDEMNMWLHAWFVDFERNRQWWCTENGLMGVAANC